MPIQEYQKKEEKIDNGDGSYSTKIKTCSNCKHFYGDSFPCENPCAACVRLSLWESQIEEPKSVVATRKNILKNTSEYLAKIQREADDKMMKEIIKADVVNHPSHYTERDMECWDWYKIAMTKEEYRGAMKANVYKYMYRAGAKDDIVQDLEKAKAYLTKLIETIKAERETPNETRPENDVHSSRPEATDNSEGC